MNSSSSRNLLPTTFAGRLLLAVLSVAIGPFAAVGLYNLILSPFPRAVGPAVAILLLHELLFSLLAASVFGFAWSIAPRPALRRFAEQGATGLLRVFILSWLLWVVLVISLLL